MLLYPKSPGNPAAFELIVERPRRIRRLDGIFARCVVSEKSAGAVSIARVSPLARPGLRLTPFFGAHKPKASCAARYRNRRIVEEGA